MKKLITLILVAVLLPGYSFAADDIKSYKDESGTTFWFTVSSSGNATIVNETNSSTTTSSAPASYSGDIVIPEYVKNEEASYKVTAIGDYAFCNCFFLKSVVIPDAVTYIGICAFYQCWDLTSIIIPEGVTSIGKKAFMGASITSVVIPKSVTSIGTQCFSSCDKLTSAVFSEGITSTGEATFSYSKSLTTVVLSESVTTIEKQCFYDCTSLSSFTIPENVTTIGEYCFYKCTSLSSVIIPESVTSIDGYAFYECSDLTSVIVPESVISIGNEAFYDCSELTQVYFTGSDYISFGKDIFENNISNLSYDYPIVYYPKGASASYSGLSSSYSSIMQEIDYSLEYENLYYYFTGLGSDGTPHAKVIADDSYSTLENVTMPETFEYNDLTFKVTKIASDAFANATNLNLTIPWTNPDEIIFEGAFTVQDNMPILYIPDDASKEDYYNSEWSKYFTIAGFPSDGYVFTDGTLYYEVISAEERTIKIINDETYKDISKLNIPAEAKFNGLTFSVTSIASNAFANAENLKSVTTTAETPIVLGENAFAQVDGATLYVYEDLRSLYAEAGWNDYFMIYGYVGDQFYDEDSGFYYEITVADNGVYEVAIIASDSYAEFTNIEIVASVEYDDKTFSVTSIASGAFANCTSLTVTVSDESAKAISIASDAFSADFEGVLTVPAGLERAYFNSDWSDYFTINGYIEGTQFANGALTYEITDQYTYEVKIVDFECSDKVVIPESVEYDYINYTITNVDDGVFCSTLKEVVVNASEPTFPANAFSGIASDAVLVVKGDTEAYISAGWGDYFDIYQFAVNGTEFAYNGVAYKITDADNELVQVTGYDSDSFPKNGELVIGTIPYNGVTYTATSIVEKAFYECLALEKITIDGCDIAANNFTNCRSLQSITITNSTINTQTFYDCQMSPDLQITGSTIKTKAFYYATFDNVNIVDCQVEKNAFFADGGFSDGKKLEFQKLKFSNCTFSEDAPFYVSYYYGIIISIEELEFEQCSFGEQLFYSYTVNFQVPLYIQTLKFSDCNELKKTMFDSISFIYITNLEVTATDLADNVFNGNSNGFYTLKITDSVIGQQAFSSCSSLQNAEIIDSQIGLYAFDSCTNLSNLIINNSVINKWAFQNCTALDNLHLLNMTEELAKESFSGCQSLSKAYIDATVPPGLEDNVFEGIDTGAILYAPFESINLYAQSTWADYFNLLGFIKDQNTGLYFQVIDNEAKTVKVISSVESSYQYETIEIPSYVGEYKVVEIDQYAFYQTPLTSVVIPETVERIGIYAFYNCYLDYVYCKATVPPTLEDAHYTFNDWYDENSNKVKITLYVPTGCVSAYESSSWYSYSIFDPILEYKELSIETNFGTSPNASIVGYYNLLGQPLNQPAKGINIIQYSDGSCKKVLVK